MSRPIRPALVKQYANQPSRTLAVIDNEDPQIKSITERERKTEKSVHFATEEESITDAESSESDSLQTSRDVISWLPSEHLYDDTFISESQPDTDVKESEEATSTGPTYGTSTFIDLESEDETRTASEYSESEGLSSSEVFSTGSATYREWKDVTEIVKDIEELEESEFVTKADTDHLRFKELEPFDEEEYTDVTDSLEADMAQEDFILSQIRRLKLGAVSSPHSLEDDSESSYTYRAPVSPRFKGPDEKARAAFCKQAIQQCKNPKDAQRRRVIDSELHERARSESNHDVAFYGLNPTIVDRLRIENLHSNLEKKMRKLDQETERSEKFVQDNQHIEEEFARQKFVQQSLGQIQKDNSTERIQAHLIKMHPVQWFSDFVRGLPKADEDSWDILYRYKTLLEKRKEQDDS